MAVKKIMSYSRMRKIIIISHHYVARLKIQHCIAPCLVHLKRGDFNDGLKCRSVGVLNVLVVFNGTPLTIVVCIIFAFIIIIVLRVSLNTFFIL